MTFPSSNLKRSLKGVYDKLGCDPTTHAELMTTTGTSQDVDLDYYETRFTTTTNSDDVAVPDGTLVGELKLLTLADLDEAGDVVNVDCTNVNATSIALDAADEYVLLQWGSTGAAAKWTVLYHNATVS